MKKKICQFMLILSIALSFGLFTETAQAYYKCWWIPGHWYWGHWIPGHKVCRVWHGHHCKWIHGHWKHGHWIPGHKVCW